MVMDSKEAGNPDSYDGEAFRKFVNDETNYAIERLNRPVYEEE